jgi:hypothetical protein
VRPNNSTNSYKVTTPKATGTASQNKRHIVQSKQMETIQPRAGKAQTAAEQKFQQKHRDIQKQLSLKAIDKIPNPFI